MKYAIKTKRKTVYAYQLGAGTDMEKQLIAEGSIRRHPDGTYELFSLESINGTGEMATAGDYFKVSESDGKYYPYPNPKDWFEANHTQIGEHEYKQKRIPLPFWQVSDSMCKEVQYLLDKGKLTIRTDDESRYFNAYLWGSFQSAAKDAAIIFREIKKDAQGNILDIEFDFIAKAEFEKDYEIC